MIGRNILGLAMGAVLISGSTLSVAAAPVMVTRAAPQDGSSENAMRGKGTFPILLALLSALALVAAAAGGGNTQEDPNTSP